MGAMAAFALVPAASAQDVSYSKAGFKSCKLVEKGEPGTWSTWKCPGKFGYLVRMEDGDERMSVSVGRTMKKAEAEPAAIIVSGPFNEAGDVIEWRSRRGRPYAIIQRWSFSPNEKPKEQWMIVTRLPPGPVCRVAMVKVDGNPDYYELARTIADQKAASFKCDSPMVKVGAGGVEEAPVP